MKKGFTKKEILDGKVAIWWNDLQAEEINSFFKECNPSNLTINSSGTTTYKYYFVFKNGFYTCTNSVEYLTKNGINKVCTIDELIKEEVMQTISRENLKNIYQNVCIELQNKIDDILRNNKFDSIIKIDDDLLKLAFKHANQEQTKMLLKYFTQPKANFQAKDLKAGEIMKVTGGVGGQIGSHILRTYDRLVCIENPYMTWDNISTNSIEGTSTVNKNLRKIL